MSLENTFAVKAKIRYVRRILRHRWNGQPRVCPYCGPSSLVKLVCRKKLIVEILRCQTCHLWFRWPADSSREHSDYYQNEFAEDTPQVILPSDVELATLKAANFSGSPLDINNKARVLKALRPGGRVLDYGCSWGYGTDQLRRCGFDAVGFEISKVRATFARKNLGITTFDTIEDLERLPEESFDVIFSNHVVEHIPDIASVFLVLTRLLKKGGIVFHVLPNFTGRMARAGYWLKWIGEDHPIAPAIPFFEIAIPRAGLAHLAFGSSPFDDRMARALSGQPGDSLTTEGDELLVYARKV
jgi:2-polyprenyl-3-methyl-5-hydroxy-6-metoxy-1,4-benzoquinol methylase